MIGAKKTIVALLIAMAGAVALYGSSEPPHAALKVGAAAPSGPQYLVAKTRAQQGVLVAACTTLDSRLGYPKAGYLGNTRDLDPDPTHMVQHATWPTQFANGWWMLALEGPMIGEWNSLLGRCRGANPKPGCAAVLSFDPPIAQSTYIALRDAIAADAGDPACADARGCSPPDDADGGTL